jgi:hypothetical protein
MEAAPMSMFQRFALSLVALVLTGLVCAASTASGLYQSLFAPAPAAGEQAAAPSHAQTDGAAELAWRVQGVAYGLADWQGHGPQDALYRAQKLSGDVILWQATAPSAVSDLARWEVFAVIVPDGTLVPVGIRLDSSTIGAEVREASLGPPGP